MEKITTEIKLDGTVKVTVTGVEGASCQDLTREFERKLGLATNDTVTEEFYHEQQVSGENLA